ncbi:hypothetical protein R3X27_16675 [Tropicimonas sp. TH_r6]|uniref:hypothetical protein n=1 Tax=Tropicimonas sp. TH_r6 TaxID=3082085 RepID=UPI002954BCCE|nr:hypothetical protein [Tropicimonas sp. TH_r6]MDV7144318.1 hypothetical protein [Tropicimonas sp. TH_r6]
MDKFVAVVCDDENTAYKATEALKELHRKGDLVIYAHGVISKDADGVAVLKKSEDEGPIGTAFGALMGAMVGVLAGPAAVAAGAAVAGTAAAATAASTGMVVGSMSGGLMGMYRDLWVSGIDAGVVDMVSTELVPGKSCLVASIDEVWSTPLDVKMKELGGIVYRKPRIDVEDDQIAAEMNELNRELDELDAEMEQAVDEMADNINEKIDNTKAKIQETNEKIDKRMDQLDAEFEARVDALDDQIQTAVGNTKTRFQKRKAELTTDYHERKAKLQKASSLAADALL